MFANFYFKFALNYQTSNLISCQIKSVWNETIKEE